MSGHLSAKLTRPQQRVSHTAMHVLIKHMDGQTVPIDTTAPDWNTTRSLLEPPKQWLRRVQSGRSSQITELGRYMLGRLLGQYIDTLHAAGFACEEMLISLERRLKLADKLSFWPQAVQVTPSRAALADHGTMLGEVVERLDNGEQSPPVDALPDPLAGGCDIDGAQSA